MWGVVMNWGLFPYRREIRVPITPMRQRLGLRHAGLMTVLLTATLLVFPASPVDAKSVQVVKVEQERYSKNRLCHYTYQYPQLKGLSNKKVERKLNTFLKQQTIGIYASLGEPVLSVDQEVEECGKEAAEGYESSKPPGPDNLYLRRVNYDIKFNEDHILSIYVYTFDHNGASPHPDIYNNFLLLDTKSGKIYQYSNLFKPRSNYQLKVNKLIYWELKRTEGEDIAQLFRDKFQKDKYSILISSKGLAIYGIFDSYAGRGIVPTLKKTTLIKEGIINPKGPLRAFLTTSTPH
ncbi:DUF4163 domain-containing protein [Anthocerotibacter panamensis]|uniref:DUF4163 domain-containing protein n=1 Tax=Anthocerotibacter panamensis TaxID=2857077 RepID=UPI001C407736|nr:DUF4163 domain-containing protein [Anthocerotibacter panamensis]